MVPSVSHASGTTAAEVMKAPPLVEAFVDDSATVGVAVAEVLLHEHTLESRPPLPLPQSVARVLHAV